MKYVKKGKEPASLTRWKRSTGDYRNKSWEELGSGIATDIRNSLIEEQGHICCYCGVEIDGRNSHIEHFKPQANGKFPLEKFDYKSNLLASCNSITTQKGKHRKKYLHCGERKGDWFDQDLIVSPLDQFCEDYFEYSSDGGIRPTKEPNKKKKARVTIKQSGLNVASLNQKRKAAIEAAFPDEELFDKGKTEARKAISLLIREFKKKNRQGKFAPFCTAIVSLLTDYL